MAEEDEPQDSYREQENQDRNGNGNIGDSKTHDISSVNESEIEKLKLPIDIGMVTLGRRGSGKTELIKWLCKQVPYDLTVLDVAGDLEELKKLGKQWYEFSDKRREVDYTMVNPHDEEKVDEIVLEAERKGRRWVVLDEADRYPYYANVKNPLSDFVNLGRHYQTGYISAARRTANLSPDFIANATYAFAFRHTNRNDIKYLLAEFEVSEEQLRSLTDYEFIVFENGSPLFKSKLEL